MNEENSYDQASQDRLLKIYGMDNKYDTALIQSAMLVNGGAAIALLTFISSIWSKGLDIPSLMMLTKSLAFFSGGVSLAVASMFFCYFRSNIFIDSSSSNEKELERKWHITIYKNLKIRVTFTFIFFFVLTVTPLLLSFTFFMCGINSAIDTFYTLLSPVTGK